MAHHQPNRVKNTLLFSALFIVGYAAFALYLSKKPVSPAHATKPARRMLTPAAAAMIRPQLRAKARPQVKGAMTTAGRHRYARSKQSRMGRGGSGIKVVAKGPRADILDIAFPSVGDTRLLTQLKGGGRFHKEIQHKGFTQLILREKEKVVFRKVFTAR